MSDTFKIGQTVYRAKYERVETYITCPDCLGSKRVRVILGDGTEVSIECGGCDPGGYESSTGIIKQYNFTTVVSPFTVTGLRTTATSVGYELNNFGSGSYWTSEGDDIFLTREEAIAHGEKLRAEHEATENKRFLSKTKDEKSWMWNYSYHMKCAAQHQRELEYHQRKAIVCKAKMKEPS